ncbi:hypothetical protein AWB64_03612 [Caballeronia sordidicola]|uniref:Transmembrane protein n=2 Tax=Caballeronia sordidicola TaxID=196367 RepID=A0A158GWU3_CABSO|nr:hypothetical protein AWB64_03612 [Caballeronia sordidicola]
MFRGNTKYFQSVVACVFGLSLIIFYANRMPTSGDLVAHFLLVDEIMRHAGVRPAPVPNIGAMALYPPGAHWLAAIVGWAQGSGLLGMVVVSIVSVFVAYLLIVHLVDPASPANVIAFAVLLRLLVRTHAQIGWEISGNFFYPQIVADVIFFSVLLWLTHNNGVLYRAPVVVGAGALAMFVQPLVALHILAAGSMLFAYDSLARWVKTRRVPSASILGAIGVAGSAVLMAFFHPSFRAMRQIAQHDGGLDLGIRYPMAAAAGCSLLGLASLWRHFSGHAKEDDAVLGSALVASVCLAFTQLAALELAGEGSTYAVKKHMFIIVTLAAVNAARLIGQSTSRFERRWPIGWLISPVIAAAISVTILNTFTAPIAPAIRAIKYANTAIKNQISGFVPGDVVALDSQNPLVSLMVTMGPFQHPYTWFGAGSPTLGAKLIMVPRDRSIDAKCPSRFAETYDYVIVAAECLKKYTVGKMLDFTLNGDGRFFLGDGWGMPTGSGTVSDGSKEAFINLQLTRSHPSEYLLTVDADVFLNKAHPTQTFDVKVNGDPVATWTFDLNNYSSLKAAVVPGALVPGDVMKISISARDPISAHEIDPSSSDPRTLGLGLKRLTVD